MAQAAALVACGGIVRAGPSRAAGEEFAFAAATVQEALASLGGVPADAAAIVLSVPDVAENGSLVPVTVECSLPDVTDIFIVVEQNPNPLVMRFSLPAGTDAYVSTRIKMAESSPVHAWVRAGGQLYATHRRTAVTVGGCH